MPQREHFYSEEAQAILGKAPSWVVRWGITVLSVILALIVLGQSAGILRHTFRSAGR